MNTQNNMEPQRPGENQIQEVRAKNPLPITDEEKMNFRNDLSNELSKIQIPQEIREKLDMFFTMHSMEMMERLTSSNQLHNRELVYQAFQRDFPELKIKKHVEENNDQYKLFENVFADFDKAFARMYKAMTLATEHFNKSCKILQKIEDTANDEVKTPEMREKEGRVLLMDLMALHKGVEGSKRYY